MTVRVAVVGRGRAGPGGVSARAFVAQPALQAACEQRYNTVRQPLQLQQPLQHLFPCRRCLCHSTYTRTVLTGLQTVWYHTQLCAVFAAVRRTLATVPLLSKTIHQDSLSVLVARRLKPGHWALFDKLIKPVREKAVPLLVLFPGPGEYVGGTLGGIGRGGGGMPQGWWEGSGLFLSCNNRVWEGGLMITLTSHPYICIYMPARMLVLFPDPAKSIGGALCFLLGGRRGSALHPLPILTMPLAQMEQHSVVVQVPAFHGRAQSWSPTLAQALAQAQAQALSPALPRLFHQSASS
jgi:hypothetical protein